MYWGADCISYMRVLGLKSVAGGVTQRQQLCAYDVVDIKGVLLLPHAVMRYCNGRVGEACRGHLLSPAVQAGVAGSLIQASVFNSQCYSECDS